MRCYINIIITVVRRGDRWWKNRAPDEWTRVRKRSSTRERQRGVREQKEGRDVEIDKKKNV